ncbi:MAG: ParB/RepB/Spo0J family partition protein [Roseovarius sp.]
MVNKKAKQRGLGRGLSALMADVADQPASSAPDVPPADLRVPIERIQPNPDQPRRHFDPELLADLSRSIAEKGVIQPLIVRVKPGAPEMFEIVAGERRWRAAQKAKLHELPVIVREFDDLEVLEIAIIENVQRADLNPVEEAAGYAQLMEKFGHTQEKLAEALGKSRSHIANTIRLMQLPSGVQAFVREGKLSAGHARSLITARDPLALAKQVIAKDLSVRATERLVKADAAKENVFSKTGQTVAGQKPPEKDADTRALEGDLSAALGMKVSIDTEKTGESGAMTIRFGSFDQLDALCGILSKN